MKFSEKIQQKKTPEQIAEKLLENLQRKGNAIAESIEGSGISGGDTNGLSGSICKRKANINCRRNSISTEMAEGFS